MDERTVTPQIRTYFWGAGCAFSGIAGLVLFLLPEETDRLFAWTITRGDTAAFIGACLLAISLVSLLCYSVPAWADVRFCFGGTLAFATAMSLATLLHLDQLHFGSDEPVALVMAWGWTLVFLTAPVAGAVLLSRQRRLPSPGGPGDGEAAASATARTTPIVPGLRRLFLAQGALLVAVGAALLVAPGSADGLWPWPLTPLAARAIASFLLGFGVMLLGVAWDDAAERLEPPCAASWWLVLLAGMAIFRFEDNVDVGTLQGMVFFVVATSLVVGGVAGEMAARRLRAVHPPTPPPAPPAPPPPPPAPPPAPPPVDSGA